jgi:hypothetical protein
MPYGSDVKERRSTLSAALRARAHGVQRASDFL